MNYGGDAADQIVRYSMEGMEHTLRISGSIAKNLAVLIVAVMKDQKKTRGKTNLLRMLKEQRAMKFFTIPHDRLRILQSPDSSYPAPGSPSLHHRQTP